MGTSYRSLCLVALLVSCQSPQDAHVLGDDDGPLATYRVQGAPPPDGVGPEFVRGGYLHPLRTPSGRVVTGDYPASHRHQHGVSFPWTRTGIEGRAVDFWNTGDGQGTLRARVLSSSATQLVAEHEFVDLTAPGGAAVVLIDRWEVSVRRDPRATVIDLVSAQRATGAPVRVLEYHYGGFTVRGAAEWEAPDSGWTFLTSAGHGLHDADGQRVRWCAISGELADGEPATVALLCHPNNLRAPQPVRAHPSRPYFCFAPCRLGAFAISREEPLVSRYRIVACDGAPDRALLDELWSEWAGLSP